MEPGCVEIVREQRYGQLFRPDNVVAGRSGSGHNWARGFFTEGAELMEELSDVLRREVELCDCLQGFQFSLGLGYVGECVCGSDDWCLVEVREVDWAH